MKSIICAFALVLCSATIAHATPSTLSDAISARAEADRERAVVELTEFFQMHPEVQLAFDKMPHRQKYGVLRKSAVAVAITYADNAPDAEVLERWRDAGLVK